MLELETFEATYINMLAIYRCIFQYNWLAIVVQKKPVK